MIRRRSGAIRDLLPTRQPKKCPTKNETARPRLQALEISRDARAAESMTIALSEAKECNCDKFLPLAKVGE